MTPSNWLTIIGLVASVVIPLVAYIARRFSGLDKEIMDSRHKQDAKFETKLEYTKRELKEDLRREIDKRNGVK